MSLCLCHKKNERSCKITNHLIFLIVYIHKTTARERDVGSQAATGEASSGKQ